METKFCVRLDEARASRLKAFLFERKLKGQKWMDATIDKLRIAADATTPTKRK